MTNRTILVGRLTRDNGNGTPDANNYGPNNPPASPSPTDNISTQSNKTPDPFANSGDTIDISDDDLPF